LGLAFGLSLVSHFMHPPNEEHLEAVYRILTYPKSALGKGLFFKKSSSKTLKCA
jgi:hypothetical protein